MFVILSSSLTQWLCYTMRILCRWNATEVIGYVVSVLDYRMTLIDESDVDPIKRNCVMSVDSELLCLGETVTIHIGTSLEPILTSHETRITQQFFALISRHHDIMYGTQSRVSPRNFYMHRNRPLFADTLYSSPDRLNDCLQHTTFFILRTFLQIKFIAHEGYSSYNDRLVEEREQCKCHEKIAERVDESHDVWRSVRDSVSTRRQPV